MTYALIVLILGLLLGLSSAGVALVFRALPWPEAWLRNPSWFWQKFWHCSICAPSRLTVAFLLAGWWFGAWWFKSIDGDPWSVLFLLGVAWGSGVYVYAFAAPPPPFVPDVAPAPEVLVPSPAAAPELAENEPLAEETNYDEFRKLAHSDPAQLVMIAAGPTPTATKIKAITALARITDPAYYAPAAAIAERATQHQNRDLRLAGLAVLSRALSSWDNSLARQKAISSIKARATDPDSEVLAVARGLLPSLPKE